MAFAQGMFEALYGGFETSFKVPPATPTADKLPVINPSFKPAVNWFTSEALTGSPEPRAPVAGKVAVDFSFELEASKESITLPYKGLFGAPVSAGTTGFYNHYYTLGTMPSMFFEQRHTDISQTFAWEGCYIGKADHTFEAEGLCKITFSGMGAVQLHAGIITGAIADKTGELALNYLNGVVKEAGVGIGYIQSINFSVDRTLDKRNHIDGTNTTGVIFGKVSKVGGTMKASFQDLALLTKALNGTETSLEVSVFTAGHGVKYTFPTILFKPTAPITNDTGLADLDFEWEAYARGVASNVSGEAVSKTFTSEALNLLTLVISPDGAANQTVTFGVADDTPTETAAAINAQTTLMTASVENGSVVIKSDTAGSTSSIQVQASSTADTVLGFDNALHIGFSAKSIVVRVSNASATVQA